MNDLNQKYNDFYHYKLRTVNHNILVQEISDIEDQHDKDMFIQGFLCSEIYNDSPKLIDDDGNYKTIMGSLVEPYPLLDEGNTFGLRYTSSKRDVLIKH